MHPPRIPFGKDEIESILPHRDPFLLGRSAPGIYAYGDVGYGPVKRVAAALGEGSMAIAFVHQYLRDARAAEAAIGPTPAPAV